MARMSVDVQLEVLVVVQEAAPGLVDREVLVVRLPLGRVPVALGDLRPHLNDLAQLLGLADGVRVRVIAWRPETGYDSRDDRDTVGEIRKDESINDVCGKL